MTFKIGGGQKNLIISVKTIVYWLDSQNPPWAEYQAFMSCRLITLDKKKGILLVVFGKNWKCLFARCVPRLNI